MTTIQLSLSYEFITSHTGDLQLRRNSFYYRIIYCHLHTEYNCFQQHQIIDLFYILFFFIPLFFLILDDILRLETPVHVLVGTPGRVCDLAERQIADLSQCNIISIDEADKLLDDFFLPTIEKILATCCTEKQILLFSATFPQTVNIKAKKESEHANGSTVVFIVFLFQRY